MKIPTTSQCDDQAYIGTTPVSHFIIGIIQLSVSAFLILSIFRRRWLPNFRMATSWVKYILPIYLPFIWAILILMGFIGFHSVLGFYIANPYLSLGKWFFLRVLSDSLTIFLHHTGIGLKSGRKSITIGFFHSLVLGLAHFFALCFTDEGDESSIVLPTQLAISIELLVIYIVILVLPITKLHRRPAVYHLAFGNMVILTGSVISFFLKFYHFDIKKDALHGKFSGGCELELVMTLLDFSQLILILHTFILDSKFWQGLYTDSRVNLNEPLQGIWDMNRDTINLVADSAIMLEKKVVPIIPFSKLKVDTKKFFSGGTARVYKGNLANNPDEVAIKFLFCIELTPDRIVDFINESTVLNSLQHPNIVKCYGVAIMPPAISLITEFCSYGSLFDFLHSTSIIRDDDIEIYDGDSEDIYYDDNFFSSSNSRKSNSEKKSYRLRTNTEDLSSKHSNNKVNYFSSLLSSLYNTLNKKKKTDLLIDKDQFHSNSHSTSFKTSDYYENNPLPSLPSKNDDDLEAEDEVFSSSLSSSLQYKKNNPLNYLVDILENNEALDTSRSSSQSPSTSTSISLSASFDNRLSQTSNSSDRISQSSNKKILSNYRLEQHHHILASPTATNTTVTTGFNRRTLPVNSSFSNLASSSSSMNPLIFDSSETNSETVQAALVPENSIDSQTIPPSAHTSNNGMNAVNVLSSAQVYSPETTSKKFKSPRTILFTREMGFGLGPITNMKNSTPRSHASLPAKLYNNTAANTTITPTASNTTSTSIQSHQDIESGYSSESNISTSTLEISSDNPNSTPNLSYRKHMSATTSTAHNSASISSSIPLSKHHLDSLLLSNTNNKKFFDNNKKNEKILGHILPLSTRLTIIRDCVAGLAYLHEKNFMHCDIKSLNFLVTNNLTVKLADLGEARMINTRAKEEVNNEKSLPSNINWSSPETLLHAMQMNQILLHKKDTDKNLLPNVSQSADIWSLAMVMSEVLSADIPFDSEEVRLLSLENFLLKLEGGLRPEISPEYQHISWLMELINSAWKYNPDDRIAASDILKRLEDIINQS